jgi:hypothetical protein
MEVSPKNMIPGVSYLIKKDTVGIYHSNSGKQVRFIINRKLQQFPITSSISRKNKTRKSRI